MRKYYVITKTEELIHISNMAVLPEGLQDVFKGSVMVLNETELESLKNLINRVEDDVRRMKQETQDKGETL